MQTNKCVDKVSRTMNRLEHCTLQERALSGYKLSLGPRCAGTCCCRHELTYGQPPGGGAKEPSWSSDCSPMQHSSLPQTESFTHQPIIYYCVQFALALLRYEEHFYSQRIFFSEKHDSREDET